MNQRIKRLLGMLLALTMVFSMIIPVSASAASTAHNPNNTVELEVGQTEKLKVSGIFQKTTWATSDQEVATVSDNGIVTGIAPGTATITATSKGFGFRGKTTIRQYTVIVTAPKENEKIEVKVGESYQLSFTTNRGSVTWKSSDPEVAQVNKRGLVTGIREGEAIITATGKEPGFRGRTTTRKFTVIVTAPEENENIEIKVGESYQLSVSTSGGKVTWKSSDLDVAKVNKKGLVTGVSEGEAVITATEKKTVGRPFFWWRPDSKPVTITTDFEVVVLSDEEPTPTYTVTFDANGGSEVADQVVEEGQTIAEPEEPTREGYTFAGWFTDEALTQEYDFTATVSGNMTLYAKWEAPITRGQWIQMLVDTYGYPSEITGNMETYADIGDSEYRSAIETAVAYDILEPVPQSNFDPGRYATREFAAVTAVNAMGYYPTGEFDCADVSDISDPAAVKQAINSGFMDLEDGYFYPNRALSKQEAERILDSLEDEFNSANDSDGSDTPEGIVYLDGVVNKPSLDWEISGNKMIIPEGEEIPEVGTIITFGTEMAIRVESVDTANGQTTITYSKPEFNEFLDYIDLEGEALMDLANFVPAEGIVVTQNTSQIATFGFADDWFDIPAGSISSGIDITLEPKDPIELTENLELSFSVDLKIPTVSYKFDVDFDSNPFNDIPAVLVKNAYIKASNDITTHISIGNGFDTGGEEFDDSIFDDIGGEREFNLGSVPLIGIDGLCVEVEVDLIVSAEGKFDIAYNVHGTAGAQVLNNELKNITALQSSMSLGIEAEVSAGPQLGFEAEIFGEDIFSFAFGAGGKAAGSVNLRSTGMVCMDGNAHVYLEIKLLEDCLIDDWLEIGVTYPIWKEDNSPFKIHGHWENLHKVPECTYENFGTIKGTVANADNRTQYIPGAVVKAFDHSDINSELVSVISDNDGRYTAQIKDGGTVLLRISANGYIPFECLQTVGAQQEVYLETFLMVEGSEDSNDTGTIGGIITNAVTGSGISGITMSVYKGWNMTTGQPVEATSTNSTGRYSVTLPIGNYTILLEKDGYITKHFNVAVTKTGNTNCGASMNPDGNSSIELGDMRIILRWTDEPSDLDSHLWGPTVDGESMFHTYYSDMSYYENGTKHAYLDRDDVDYNGPETTTVYNMTPNGTYSFFIHDFTNRNRTGSTVMANSGAYVEVYIGENNIATYYVPTSGVGNVWHVFDFDAVNGTITGVNAFSSNSDPSTVGSPVATFALRPETVPDKQTAKETTEDTDEETTEAITEDSSEETTEVTTEGIAKETTEDTSEKTTEITKEDTAEDTTEEMVEESTEDSVTECSEENSTV